MPAADDPGLPAEAGLPWNEAPLARLLAAEPPQALLLSGPAGIGKAALAAAFGQALLCERRADGQGACRACAACGWVRQGSHPDLRRIGPQTDGRGEAEATEQAEPGEAAAAAGPSAARVSRAIRLPQVQQLGEFVAVGGHRGARRVVIVEPADALNPPAANALLKTLEEPPAGAVFLLVTARPAVLLPTIRSRCRHLPLPRPVRAQALAWLREQLPAGTDVADAEALLAAAGGAPLAALALGDTARGTAHRALVDAIARLPDTGLTETADALAGVPPPELVAALQRWLVDLARVGADCAPLYHSAQRSRLADLARRASAPRLADADLRLARQRALAEHPLNARLFVEQALHDYARAFAAGRPAHGDRA